MSSYLNKMEKSEMQNQDQNSYFVDEDQNSYFVNDKVTYLKDSKKEPSINTLIQQDLIQQPMLISDPELNLPPSRSPSPTQSSIPAKISPFSQDPMLNTAFYNESNDSCSNYDIGKYSPEIVQTRRRRRRTYKPKSKQPTRENQTLQQLEAQPNVLNCPSSNVIITHSPKDLGLDKEGSANILSDVIPVKKNITFPINPTNTISKFGSPGENEIAQAQVLTESLQSSNCNPTETQISTGHPKIINQGSSTVTCTLTPEVGAAHDKIIIEDKLSLDLSKREIKDISDNHQHSPERQTPTSPNSLTSFPSLASLSLAEISKNLLYSMSAHSSNNLSTKSGKESYSMPSTSRADSSVSSNPSFHFDDPWDGDFSPDDGDTDYQPSDQLNTSQSSDESLTLELVNESREKRKRAKRGKANKENWAYNLNKNKRMKGESYSGRRKTVDGKTVFDLERNQRSVKPRCDHNDRCKYFDCHKLTEEARNKLFKKYWKLSWETKKIWVQQTVLKQSVARRKCSGNSLRRGNTFKYTFNVSGEKYKVCKKMYLNTLNIGEWSVHNWTQNEDKDVASGNTRRNENVKAFEDIGRNAVKEFLNKLPKLESHYCRKTTSKLYLEQIWQSKEQLYREYVKHLLENGIDNFKVSQKIFFQEFDAMNLSLFSPKKDQCDVCCAFTVGNITQDVYTAHREKKERARQEKTADKYNSGPDTKVFTFDLQAVLLSPLSNASALYYKTKLKVHNFTLYDTKNKDGYCYIWHECEGGLSANEFSSILQHFIEHYIPPKIKHIIFWSDGCTNQNRNAILANALLQIAVQKDITITQKYLEKGHTQMEADSMHSIIERKLKDREIYSPAQYIDICRSARLQKPYLVNYLNHSNFRKFNSMPYLNSIRPGKKTGETTVFDLRCIEYRPDGTIHIKQEFSEEFEELRRRIKKPRPSDSMPRLYDARIPIPRTKYIHLQELKAILPQDFHSFYDGLPHECPDDRRNGNICSCRRDVLIGNP